MEQKPVRRIKTAPQIFGWQQQLGAHFRICTEDKSKGDLAATLPRNTNFPQILDQPSPAIQKQSARMILRQRDSLLALKPYEVAEQGLCLS
jgi:hypothetical protein